MIFYNKRASEIMGRYAMNPEDWWLKSARLEACLKANKVSNWIRVRKYAREMLKA